MLVQHFNRGHKHAKRRDKRFVGPPTEDVMGVLHPGFEEQGTWDDYQVTPGVMAHFDTLEDPPAGYYSMHSLERVHEAA